MSITNMLRYVVSREYLSVLSIHSFTYLSVQQTQTPTCVGSCAGYWEYRDEQSRTHNPLVKTDTKAVEYKRVWVLCEKKARSTLPREGHAAQPDYWCRAAVKEGFLQYFWLSWSLTEEKQSAKMGVGVGCLGGGAEILGRPSQMSKVPEIWSQYLFWRLWITLSHPWSMVLQVKVKEAGEGRVRSERPCSVRC